MNFLTFAKELKNYPAFSLRDTERLSGKVYYHRLAEWQKQGYIRRIANGVFIFSEEQLEEMHLFYVANRVYHPSYISLETAFSYYGFIPEGVYQITSVTSKKTAQFQNENLVFNYRTINRQYMFGYTLFTWRNVAVRFAEPEKAVLDYFYLNPKHATPAHIDSMRFNRAAMAELLDWEKINNYLSLYNNKALQRRLHILKEQVQLA